MSYKLIDATEVRNGTTIMIEGEPCTVRSYDVSKTGKHGHAKVRLEAIGIFDGKKRVTVQPGHERFEVPLIEKKKGQVLSVSGKNASLMDLESFETIEVPIPEEVEGDIKEESQVEYWDIDGRKIIKRVI
ncbi:MAG TPA: translation initiation factor IF-5A [Candidatus Paceibacterota bacterium]|nr:translation initiation factor IF-5A [Candidatus Paceibacterota bacterium]